MATLDSLLAACATPKETLAQCTQKHISLWESWLLPISEAAPAGDDPVCDDRCFSDNVT